VGALDWYIAPNPFGYAAAVPMRSNCNPLAPRMACQRARGLTLPSSGQSTGCARRLPLKSNVRPQSRIPSALRRESERCILAGLASLLEHPDCGAPEASKLFELNSTGLSRSPVTQSLLHETRGTGSGRRSASVGSGGHRKRERFCPSLRRRTERESRQFLAAPSTVSAV
jgi:hypothetical protein